MKKINILKWNRQWNQNQNTADLNTASSDKWLHWVSRWRSLWLPMFNIIGIDIDIYILIFTLHWFPHVFDFYMLSHKTLLNALTCDPESGFGHVTWPLNSDPQLVFCTQIHAGLLWFTPRSDGSEPVTLSHCVMWLLERRSLVLIPSVNNWYCVFSFCLWMFSCNCT